MPRITPSIKKLDWRRNKSETYFTIKREGGKMHANTENIQGIFQNWRGEICNIRKYEHTKSEAFLFLYKIAACAWTGNGIFVSSL